MLIMATGKTALVLRIAPTILDNCVKLSHTVKCKKNRG